MMLQDPQRALLLSLTVLVWVIILVIVGTVLYRALS